MSSSLTCWNYSSWSLIPNSSYLWQSFILVLLDWTGAYSSIRCYPIQIVSTACTRNLHKQHSIDNLHMQPAHATQYRQPAHATCTRNTVSTTCTRNLHTQPAHVTQYWQPAHAQEVALQLTAALLQRYKTELSGSCWQALALPCLPH
jgi:hypothetical protein